MRTLHRLLRDSTDRFPEREAVRDPSRDTRATYADLSRHAGEIGQALNDLGFAPGDRLGICAPKSIGVVAALFGALEAGGAYVPVDADAPVQRNAFIFQDCGVRALVADRKIVEKLQGAWAGTAPTVVRDLEFLQDYGVDLVLLAAPPSDVTTPELPEDEGPLSYILYTSGSTGKPKGVMHSHRTALSFVDWCSEVYEPTEHDRFSSHAPFHFDLSILDLYVPIKHGAAMVLFGESLGKQPAQLAETIANEKISAWYSTPSILRLLVEYGQLDERDFSSLRIVNFAGEVFPIKHLLALKALWSGPTYYNLYGPTETNVCTYYPVPDDIDSQRSEPFPIGVACSGDAARVVDEQGNDVADGADGELVISGGSVMLGYWNLPERNAEASFHQDGTAWYKTGDVVRTDENGDYLFVGRRDRMIKRRGYRVELGEIESALHRHESIGEVAVIAIEDGDAAMVVVAFHDWHGEKPPSMIALKGYCSQNLPMYMIPDKFSVQPSLPKTSTDKIDYQKLKEMA